MSFSDLSGAKKISLDIETFDPELMKKGPGVRRNGYIVGVAVGTDDGFRNYFPLRHPGGGNCDIGQVYAWLSEQLSRPGQPVVGANLLYDLDYLTYAGVKITGPFYDVQNAEPLLDENLGHYNLDSLGLRHLGEGKRSELYEWCATHFGGKPDDNQRANIWQCPADIVTPYAIGDIDLPLRILEKQLVLLEREELLGVFDIESRLTPLLLAMRQHGCRVDVEKAEILTKEFDRQTEILQAELNEIAGFYVNTNASASKAQLFDKLGLNYPMTHPSKTCKYPEKHVPKPSFTADWLKTVQHPVAQKIVDLMQVKKLNETFVKSYILESHINGRVHCEFNQLRTDEYGTVTGRFSSSHPNLQNIPKRKKDLAKKIRGLFIPDDGCFWNMADLSQIEFRLLVHYAAGITDGPEIREAIRQYREDPKTDYHNFVVKLTGLERRPAKDINFGFVYGMGRAKLAIKLGKPQSESDPLYDKYNAALPFAKQTYNFACNVAKERGYIKTLLGRRRRFPHGKKIHAALNAVLQGGCAEILKKAMVTLWERTDLPVEVRRPMLTVHDELDSSLPLGEEGQAYSKEIKHIMESAFVIRVPILAEVETGPNWGSLTKVDSNG